MNATCSAAPHEPPQNAVSRGPAIERHPQVFPTKAAKRRRYSNLETPVEIQECVCIKGGRLREWLALPVEEHGGTTWTKFCSKMPWITMLLSGRVRSGELFSAVRAVKQLIIQRAELKVADERARALTAVRTARAALEVSDDDDEGDDEDKKGTETRPATGPREVEVNLFDEKGQAVPTLVLYRQGNTLVEVKVRVISALCDEVRRAVVPATVRAFREKRAAAERASLVACAGNPKASRPIELEGRVCFSHAKRAFCVTYKDADNVRRVSRKGLKVSGDGKQGGAYRAQLDKTRIMAMAMWDELDKSDRPRFNVAKASPIG